MPGAGRAVSLLFDADPLARSRAENNAGEVRAFAMVFYPLATPEFRDNFDALVQSFVGNCWWDTVTFCLVMVLLLCFPGSDPCCTGE